MHIHYKSPFTMSRLTETGVESVEMVKRCHTRATILSSCIHAGKPLHVPASASTSECPSLGVMRVRVIDGSAVFLEKFEIHSNIRYSLGSGSKKLRALE